MKIVGSAPSKVHVAGEHSVVYGGWALMAPVKMNGKRNVVELTAGKGEPRLYYKGDYGAITLNAGGGRSGDSVYNPVMDCAEHILDETGKDLREKVNAIVFSNGAPKGTGNSASIPAAFASAFYAYLGKKPSRKELYDAVFTADNAWHAGLSSGGDVNAVLADCPQKFKRVFKSDGTVEVFYEDSRISLPEDAVLLLVDSFLGGEKASTAVQIRLFAEAHGIAEKPAQLGRGEREKIVAPFNDVIRRIERECRPDGDAVKLGRLLDENHALLESVSAPDIEKVVGVAKEQGALGGKLIGAGGKGGAVLVLAMKKDSAGISASLQSKGFKCFELEISDKGAGVDSVKK